MFRSITQQQNFHSLPVTTDHDDVTADDEWVAIRDNFPSLIPGQLQVQSSISTEISHLNQNTFKFEVDATSDPKLYILNCRKVELNDKKNSKLQPRVKNNSQNREISQQFEVLDIHTEQLSIERMENAHKILQQLYGDVKIEVEDELKLFPSFPNISLPSYGLWSYISGSQWEPSDNCRELEEYYTSLYQFCPSDLFMEIIFAASEQNSSQNNESSNDDNRLEKYEECFSELNRNTYQSNIKKYRTNLHTLEQKKQSLDIRTIEELLEFYCELDESYYFLEHALSEMFLYESQPFEDDYSISMVERDRLRTELSDPCVAGELSDEDFMEMCERERAEEEEVLKASARIHELTIYHIQELAQLIESQLEQSRLDKEACTGVWDERAELRLQKLEAKLNNMLINLLSIQIDCLQDAKERNILSIVSMEETEDFSECLKRKETTVFTIESQLIDIKLRLIAEQENMYKHRIILFENDRESQELIGKKMDNLGRKKARLRTKQRLVKNAQTEAGKDISTAATKVQSVLEDSFYSELVIQKRKDANSKIAANKYDRIKKERVKTIQRVKQKITDNPKDERKLPPSYLPPSQRKGTILDTKNKRTRHQQQQSPPSQPISRLQKLNITPSIAHHYPSIDSSLSISTNSFNIDQKSTTVKKLQTRTIRNNRNTSTQRNKGKQISNTSKQLPNKDEEISKYNIPDPPPDIPNEIIENSTNKTSQKLTDILHARKTLPKDMESTLIPSNPHDSMMKIIRSGVKLRAIKNDKLNINPNASLSDGAHASLLKAVASISLSTQDSDSDSQNGDEQTW